MSRYFFALWPDNTLRKVISNCSEHLPITGSKINKLNFHITLLFMGKLNKQQLKTIIGNSKQINCPKFDICLNHNGYFKNSKVTWLGLKSIPDSLLQLHNLLSQAAKQSNIFIKPQQYKPHLSLSRKASALSKQEIKPIQWTIKDFALVESIDTAKGVIYQPIQQFSCY